MTDFDKIAIDITSASDESVNASLGVTVTVTAGNSDITVAADGVYAQDGVIYLKLSKLDQDLLSQVTSGFSEIIAPTTKLDGVWWKISVPEIADMIKNIQMILTPSSSKNLTNA